MTASIRSMRHTPESPAANVTSSGGAIKNSLSAAQAVVISQFICLPVVGHSSSDDFHHGLLTPELSRAAKRLGLNELLGVRLMLAPTQQIQARLALDGVPGQEQAQLEGSAMRFRSNS